jgi:hypothetical protein
MKALSWLKYFVYFLLVVLFIWVKGPLETLFQNNSASKVNYFLYSLVVLYPIVFGVIFGLEAFINERARIGKWKLNLPKLILIIIPSLYVSALYFIALIPNQKVSDIFIAPMLKLFGTSGYFITIFQILLGYSLMTLFFKSTVAKVEENKTFDEVYEKENDTCDEVIPEIPQDEAEDSVDESIVTESNSEDNAK